MSEMEQNIAADCASAGNAGERLSAHQPVLTPGTITLAGTPIGNSADASQRLCRALSEASIVAAEDTRRARELAARLGVKITGKVVSLFEHNEAAKTPELLAEANAGATILFISDAGMPTVSDPGFRLVQGAIAAAVPVTVIPGPSAVLTALALSGLPTDRFSFEGFVPRKDGARESFFAQLAQAQRTLVFFDSPRRVHDTLTVMARVFGADRRVALCRELTKIHEEVLRGTLAELVQRTAEEVLGEVVLVVDGATPTTPDSSDKVSEVQELVAGGMKLKAAAGYIAKRYGLRKNELYQAVLAAK